MAVPQITLKQVLDDPSVASRIAGKAVFLGVTAMTKALDSTRSRWMDFSPAGAAA
jgi:hypothetical protein